MSSKKKKRKTGLSPQQKEQNKHVKLIRGVMENMGFTRIPGVDQKQFSFMDRQGELDDAFYYENILVLLEYTVQNPPHDHFIKKTLLFSRINENKENFIKFIKQETALKGLANGLAKIEEKYSVPEIQIRIIYASKYDLPDESKKLSSDVYFFDYGIVKYFEIIARAIKKTAIYEFLDFINIAHKKLGENIKKSSVGDTEEFFAEILPETKSCNIDGIKIVTFYINAISLLKRAYVLRNDSWRNEENVKLFQRLLIPRKIKKMREYLTKEQRVFVNNIIATLSSDDIKLHSQKGEFLEINDDGKIANVDTETTPAKISIAAKSNVIGIIDGQHRVFAYHEGNDVHENTIKKLRDSQNLLVTGIVLPKIWPTDKKIRFQAKLFLEINANQQGAHSELKQSIDSILNPASATSISKHIIEKLNESGPLKEQFALRLSDEHKIKTASIISFALNILVRPGNQQGFWGVWDSDKKSDLLLDEVPVETLNNYKEFCISKIRDFLIAIKDNISKEKWQISTRKSDGILNVTTINGWLHCIRQLIEYKNIDNVDSYRNKLKGIDSFNFKQYKSSQYNKLGKDLYKSFWG